MKIINHETGGIIYVNNKINSMKELVEEAIRKGISLAYADLAGCDLEGAELSNGNFSKSRLNSASFDNATGKNVNFSDARMKAVSMAKAKFIKCNFSHTGLRHAFLQGGFFNGSNFDGANMMNADLRNAVFDKANMNYTFLSNAEIVGAILEGVVNLENALYNGDQMKRDLQKNIDYMEQYVERDNMGISKRKKPLDNTDSIGFSIDEITRYNKILEAQDAKWSKGWKHRAKEELKAGNISKEEHDEWVKDSILPKRVFNKKKKSFQFCFEGQDEWIKNPKFTKKIYIAKQEYANEKISQEEFKNLIKEIFKDKLTSGAIPQELHDRLIKNLISEVISEEETNEDSENQLLEFDPTHPTLKSIKQGRENDIKWNKSMAKKFANFEMTKAVYDSLIKDVSSEKELETS